MEIEIDADEFVGLEGSIYILSTKTAKYMRGRQLDRS